jgi:raffinose/stachyose/melibiose transport system permease protein
MTEVTPSGTRPARPQVTGADQGQRAGPAGSGRPGRPAWLRRRRARDALAGYLFLLPAAILIGLFLAEPFVKAIQYSLQNWDGVGVARYVGLFNYQQIFVNPVERGSLVNLGILFIFYALVPTAAGLIAAGLIRRSRQRGIGVFRFVFFLPQVIVTVVVAIVWTWLMAPSGTGSINGLLHAVGLGPAVGTPWLGDFNTALIAVGLIAVWLDFGLCFVLFLAGIQRISPDLYDAARIDGAGLVTEFLKITVPLLRRETAAAITITTVAALQSFTLIYQATNGGPGYATMVPGLLVYRDGFQLGQVGTASALGIMMSLLIFGLTFGIRALIERKAT